MLILGLLLPDPLRFDPVALTVTTCQPHTTMPAILEGVLPPDRIAPLQICPVRGIAGPAATQLSVIYDYASNGTVTSQKTLSVQTTADLRTIALVLPSLPFQLLALILISTAFAAKGWRTPGKALLGLRLVVPAGTSAKRFLLREVLRVLPVLLFGLAVLGQTLQAKSTPADAQLADLIATLNGIDKGGLLQFFLPRLAMAIAGLIFVVWYYDWLTLRWRGAFRHDRICGFTLRRNLDQSPPSA